MCKQSRFILKSSFCAFCYTLKTTICSHFETSSLRCMVHVLSGNPTVRIFGFCSERNLWLWVWMTEKGNSFHSMFMDIYVGARQMWVKITLCIREVLVCTLYVGSHYLLLFCFWGLPEEVVWFGQGESGVRMINYEFSFWLLTTTCFILYCYQYKNKSAQIVLFQKFSACF